MALLKVYLLQSNFIQVWFNLKIKCRMKKIVQFYNFLPIWPILSFVCKLNIWSYVDTDLLWKCSTLDIWASNFQIYQCWVNWHYWQRQEKIWQSLTWWYNLNMTNSRDDYNLSQPFSLGFSAKISIDPIKLQCQVHSTSNRQECK